MSENKKYKYTELGLYVRPDLSRLPKDMDPSKAKAYLKVYTGKAGNPITLNPGDLLIFTKAEDKIADLKLAHANNKLSEDSLNKMLKLYEQDTIICSVTVKQAL
jgi:hypothetical protein